MRYIDLMGGQKPHLLIRMMNNLGAETVVHYAPSTKFYLADKQNGKPWITRLSFPVHCVERVETYDRVNRNRFVTRYTYHHGYFDGEEREFRGFGMVEQIDTEEFAALNRSDAFPTGDNIDEASHIPPVLTRSWFHTGAYLGGQRISNFFAGLLGEEDNGEYYREPGLSDEEAARLLLPDTILPEDLTVEEEREACRALKGSMLRQEVFALDGTEEEPHPYTVAEQNFTIQVLQRRGENRHAVFYTHTREAINYHYERNPADPRISHNLTLAVDNFGNVLRSAAVGYGRHQPDPGLRSTDQERQAQVLMTCSENAYTNPVQEDDDYRAPLASETLSFELTGLALGPGQVRFRFVQMEEAVESAAPIDYHQAPNNGLQKRVLDHARTLYRRDDLTDALPLGELQSLALPFETYQLAFTPDHVELIFGDRVTNTVLSDEGRYVHFAGDDNWWVPSGRVFVSSHEADNAAQELAFAQQHFFLPLRFRDPFAHTTTVEYDAHDVLMVRTTDPLENSVTAGYDYRRLAPERMTDPNGNRSAVAFDVLGLVAGTAVMGKASENFGDSLDNFQAQLTQEQIDAFFADPRGPIAAQLLGSATSRIIYDEARFQRLEQPAFAATILRETHVSDLAADEETRVQVSLAYSDGFGREIQRKIQAEPGPVEAGGPDIEPRWTTSGWIIFNNKGEPVRQFEPFFSAGHVFEFGVVVGVSPTLFYDPIGRVVGTLHPNHTWEKVVFDPWRQESWDVNDTVLVADPASDPDVGDHFERIDDSEYLPTWHQVRIAGGLGGREQDAAQKAAAHADTPAIIHFDSLGRPFLSIADNGDSDQFETRTEQDIEGNPLRVIDARGNAVMAYQVAVDGHPRVLGYDVAGRQLYELSMDAGERRSLADVVGQPIRSWDSRGHIFRTEYDELRRPTRSLVTGVDVNDPNREMLFEQTVYGEGQGDAFNHRGRVFQVFDGAGVVTSHAYDFKGNLLLSSRQLLANNKDAVDWNTNPALEVEVFSSQTRFDALNRPVAITTPDESITLPTYNEANLLEQMTVRLRGVDQATLFVADIDYNARGQREQIIYATSDGTNFTTFHTYDRETFRLSRLRTVRHRDNRDLQDLNYAYDPVGNITSIQDNAQQTVFFSNAQIDPHNDYTYDPLYRLIRAEGREHAAQNNIQRDAADFDPVIGIPFPNSPQALQRYVELYAYDGVGNILSVRHVGGAIERWTRRYQYAGDNNRLLATSLPGDEANQFSSPISYDPHGNMTRMSHLPLMRWNFQDQMEATSRQVVNNGGTPETTYYVYDAAGQRVRKVVERQAAAAQIPTRRNERIYLGGFEIYREYEIDGATALERQTLHVIDDHQRIAFVETRVQGNDDAPPQSHRFQLGNHLGSAMLEADDQANILSYEEYHPYGTSAYRAGRSAAEASLKRYRYTGKERDEVSGFYYHGARYYASWLGRWTSCDPAVSTNLYVYASGNPTKFVDPNGMSPAPPQTVGPYQTVRGDHVHQVASRTAGPGAKRTSAPQFNQGLSVSTKTPTYLDRPGQKIEAAINRAAWGKDYDTKPAGSKGTVTLKSTGTTSVGKAHAATPSPWFEDIKSFFKLREAGVPSDEALKLVDKSGEQLKAAGATPKRVPQAPRSTPSGLKAGQTLSAESGAANAATAGWGSKIASGIGAAGAFIGSFAGGYQVGTGAVQIKEGKTGEGVTTMAEGTANLGLTIGTTAAVKAKMITTTGSTGITGGILTFAAGLAAAGATALAAEETRRAIRGEKTMAAEATDYWKEVQRDAPLEPSVGGALEYVAAEVAGSATGFIASGQEDLWGLLR
jgi:RHS repeat-associated protein